MAENNNFEKDFLNYDHCKLFHFFQRALFVCKVFAAPICFTKGYKCHTSFLILAKKNCKCEKKFALDNKTLKGQELGPPNKTLAPGSFKSHVGKYFLEKRSLLCDEHFIGAVNQNANLVK